MIHEYRAYYIMPGRMPDIQKRFAEATMKHGPLVERVDNKLWRPTSFSPIQ